MYLGLPSTPRKAVAIHKEASISGARIAPSLGIDHQERPSSRHPSSISVDLPGNDLRDSLLTL